MVILLIVLNHLKWREGKKHVIFCICIITYHIPQYLTTHLLNQIPHYLFAANLAVLTHATEVDSAYDVDFGREKVTSPKSIPGGCAIALGT